MNQSILEKIFNKKSPSYWWYEALESWKQTEDIKKTLKKLTQQLNHEIDLCKKDLQQHLEKKGKVDLIFKSLLSLSVKDERMVVSPNWGKFCYFFALFEIIFLLWWMKILKIILWRLWVGKKIWIRQFTPSSFTVVNSTLPPTKFSKLAIARWHCFEMQMIQKSLCKELYS